MIPVIVIRPQPGCDTTVEAARAVGLDARGFPLFEVRPVTWDAPPRHEFDALLIGSANAIRHGGPAIGRYTGKPAYAVGQATADAAREAGLAVVSVGKGGLQRVLDQVRPEHPRLLRLAGRERVPLQPPLGVTVSERVVYASEPLPMPPDLAELLAGPALILLHSGEAASHFARLCDEAGVTRERLLLATLGPRIASAAGEGWGAVRVAYPPSDPALLAIAREMCQEAGAMTTDQPGATQDEPLSRPLPVAHRSGGLRTSLALALLAFILGVGLAGWLAWRGTLDTLLPLRAERNQAPAASVMAAPPPKTAPQPDVAVTTIEGRVALIEDRLSRITDEANSASGNAARAEGLLIASATRRAIERGAPLGVLEDQLKLRFGDAQPNAVRTIVTAARQPLTLYWLSSQLEEAAPALAGAPAEENNWASLRREISSLFVIRRAAPSAATPLERAQRAQILLKSGEIEKAIAEIERLPGAADAQGWIAAARRYDNVQRALDQIETAALLEPRRLRDDRGRPVEQPSPVAPPASTPVT